MIWRRYIVLATILLLSALIVWVLPGRSMDLPQPEPAAAPLPDELRMRLVETLKKESLFDSLKNLPNYDDCGYTMGSVGGGETPDHSRYEFAREYFPALNRVKRILEQAERDRPALEKGLVEQLSSATKAFPKAFRAELDKLRELGGYSSSEPSECDSCQAYGGACTYLLAELRVHSALPLMARISRRKSVIPVNRVFLFYAMHRLTETHPIDRLPPDARLALDAYLKSVAWLPEPKRTKVATGLALVDEWDLRQRLMGIDVGLAKQPQMEIDIYPPLEMITEDPGYFSTNVSKLEEPLALLRTFVDRAYPDSKKPAADKK